jgi:hemerythrin-like domain-containing protein
MKSTQLLMADHELILQALHVLDAMNTKIRERNAVNPSDIGLLLTFLREFADGSHHVKEEAIFVPTLMQAGMPIQAGPLRAMISEHERGRALTAAMQDAVDHKRIDDFVMYSRQYITLLTDHIDKENRVLFEKADQILSDDEDETLAASFDHFEKVTIGAQTHERVRHTIEVLASKYLEKVHAGT